mgnify:CR=1 FL=1
MDKNTTNNLLKLMTKSSLIALLGSFFPVLYILFPAMFVAESLKEGIVKVMGCFIGVCLILAILISPVVGISVLTMFGPMILIFNYMIINKYDVNTTIVVNAIIFFVSMIFISYTFGITPETLKSQDTISKFIEMQKELLDASVNVDFSTSNITMIYNRTLQIMPAILLLMSLFISYTTYTITGRTLLKENRIIMQPSSFIFFRLPNGIVISSIIGVAGVFLFQELIGENYFVIIENIVIVMGTLLLFEGLSVAKFLMMKARMASILQILIIVCALIIPGVQIIFIVLGFFDVLLNFRNVPN